MNETTTKLMFSSADNTWATPKPFYNKLDREFAFSLDPCCGPETAKCGAYFTEELDGLIQDWHEVGHWLNKETNEICRCKCHVYYANDAEWRRRQLLRTSGGILAPAAASIPTARTATEKTAESGKRDVEITPLSESDYSTKSDAIAHQNVVAQPSEGSPSSPTMSGASAISLCRSSGDETTGCDASDSGENDARIADEMVSSPKIISSRSAIQAAQGPFHGTWSLPVHPATTQSNIALPLNGAKTSPGWSTPCKSCRDCAQTQASIFVNPPYGDAEYPCEPDCKKKKCAERGWHADRYIPGIMDFMRKSYLESCLGATVVCLVPNRSCSDWYHRYVLGKADEVRQVRGRLKFEKPDGGGMSAPFPSIVIVYRPLMRATRLEGMSRL